MSLKARNFVLGFLGAATAMSAVVAFSATVDLNVEEAYAVQDDYVRITDISNFSGGLVYLGVNTNSGLECATSTFGSKAVDVSLNEDEWMPIELSKNTDGSTFTLKITDGDKKDNYFGIGTSTSINVSSTAVNLSMVYLDKRDDFVISKDSASYCIAYNTGSKDVRQGRLTTMNSESDSTYKVVGLYYKPSSKNLTGLRVEYDDTFKSSQKQFHNFDATGIKVFATYEGDDDADVTGLVKWSVERLDEPGEITVVGSYSENGKTFECEVRITVEAAVLEGIRIDTSAVQKSFFVGDSFSSSGLKVFSVYDSGNEFEVSDYELSISNGHEFTAEEAGDNEVRISYKGFEQSYVVAVAFEPITKEYKIAKGGDIDFVEANPTVSSLKRSSYRLFSTGSDTNRWSAYYAKSNADYRVIPDTKKIAFGTNDYYGDFRIRSGVYESEREYFGIKSVSITVRASSTRTQANLEINVAGQKIYDDALKVVSNSSDIVVECSLEQALPGHLEFNFTNVQRGIQLYSISVTSVPLDQETTAAYSFAHDLEQMDGCDGSNYDDIYERYLNLSESARKIADNIYLDDINEDATDEVVFDRYTVLDKLSSLQNQKAKNDAGNPAGLPEIFGGSESSATYVTAGLLFALSAASVCAFALKSRKKQG